MKNYKNYFEADNSCYLIDKFSVEKRNGVGEELKDFSGYLRSKNRIGGKNNNNLEQNGATKKVTFKRSTLKTLKAMCAEAQS